MGLASLAVASPLSGLYQAFTYYLNIDCPLSDEPALSMKEDVMISLRQRLQCLPLLCGGVSVGLVLALIVRLSSGSEPASLVLVAGLSFLLAALTGMAKTTTA